MKTYKKVISAIALISTMLSHSAWSFNADKYKKNGFFSPVNTLVDAAKKSRIKMGAAVSNGVLNSGEETYINLLNTEFNYVTPENIAKWGSLQPNASDEWTFDSLDSMLSHTQENDQKFKGHALVWHRQAPSFITHELSPEDITALIEQHIHTTMTRYSGEIYAWDVVNEAIGDDANFRDSIFFQKLGKDYIAAAFHTARATDKKAKLYYNDYGIAGLNAKSDAVYNLVKELKENGVPIDGVGFQMHLEAATAPSTEEMVTNLKRFTKLGLTVNISELDVRVASLPWDQATKLAVQQQVYHRAVNACLKVSRCDAVTTWGFTDKYTWVNGEFGADDPLQYDADYQRKPAYFGLADGLMKIQADDISAMPNLIANGNFEIGTDGWTTWAGTMVRSQFFAKNGRGAIRIKDRTDTWHGAVYDITVLVQAGQTYDASAWAKVGRKFKDNIALSTLFRCEGEQDQYGTITNTTGNAFRWKQLSGEITVPDCIIEAASLYIEGPAANVDLYVDKVSLRPQILVPDTTGFGPNLIENGDFEGDASGWFGFGDTLIDISTDKVYAGIQSGLATNRLDTWQGPAYSVLTIIEAGQTYQLFSWVSLSEGSEQVRATIKVSCPAGDQYIGIGGSNPSSNGYTMLAGKATMPNCDMQAAELYFEGPSAGVDIYFDEVTLHKKESESGSSTNIVENNDFESNVDGWSAWGDAIISTSANFAYTGSQSALLSNRTGTWQGPVFDLLPFAQPEAYYEISVFARIDGTDSDNLSATVKTVCDDGTEAYTQAGVTTVNNTDWTGLTGSITLPACVLTETFVYFDGAAAGVDVYIDNVTISTSTPSDPDNIITNATFEEGTNGWVTWGDASMTTAEVAHSGNQSALIQTRTASWQGPVYDFLSQATANATYDISAWMQVAGSVSENVSITVKTTCDGAAETYDSAGIATLTDTEWTEVSGSIQLPDCVLTEAVVYFDGVSAGVDVYIDDVSMKIAL